jgi:hypothetical protein
VNDHPSLPKSPTPSFLSKVYTSQPEPTNQWLVSLPNLGQVFNYGIHSENVHFWQKLLKHWESQFQWNSIRNHPHFMSCFKTI